MVLLYVLWVLFNDAANSHYNIASVIDEWMCIEHWCSDADEWKTKCSGRSTCPVPSLSKVMLRDFNDNGYVYVMVILGAGVKKGRRKGTWCL